MELTRLELFTRAIEGMKSKLNKKALKEVLNDNVHNTDLNEILFRYYLRSRYSKQRFEELNIRFIYGNDYEDAKEFLNSIKDDYRMKRYKRDYDYIQLGEIKNTNTMMIWTANNGWVVRGHYCFDMYQFIEVNGFEVVEV